MSGFNSGGALPAGARSWCSEMFPTLPKAEKGRVFDLPPYVDRLMRSRDLHAYVIIDIAHSGDFMQLSGDASGVQIDFPQITPRQQSFEGKIREVAARAGLEVVENYGSDGSCFLDLNVSGEWRSVAAVCSKVLRGVYGVSGDAELIFKHAGLAPRDAT